MLYTPVSALQRYVEELQYSQRVRRYLQRHPPLWEGMPSTPLQVVVWANPKDTLGIVGGEANLLFNRITLPQWMLADEEEAKATIRHEFAHFLTFWTHGYQKGSRHGDKFYSCLRAVSGPTWKRDRRWLPSPAIRQARALAGIPT